MIRFILQIEFLQLFRLFAGGKGVDDLIEVAVQDLCKVVHRQADAVVGAAVLREVVGADLLAAVAGAHLPLPLGVDGVLLFLLLLGQQAAAQDLQCLVLVLKLAALVLALHHHAGGDVRQLSVIKKGKMLDVTLNQSEGITESSYEETTDNMINKVAIYNSKNKKIGTVSNKNWISTYGTFQDSLSVEKGNGKKEAKNTLTGLEKTASLTAIGDIRCISGYGIKIHDVDSGLDGNFWIENDSHTFENGIHTMTLELAFKNIMETESDDAESSSSSGTVSTGILNGRKVKALFTAYYPASNKMEGGYYDCKGKKLDPSKYTCAAPGSVKYGTQIQVLGTKTSRDKKVHKVNDRGGAIKIVNGVYHFDLLMKTKAQCNRFGKRTGYAIIGNGTGFKQKKVDTKQADKVISKAKKYIGKVNYVFGASSPDLGKSDCSGFTSFVFRKATGKQIGRSAKRSGDKRK